MLKIMPKALARNFLLAGALVTAPLATATSCTFPANSESEMTTSSAVAQASKSNAVRGKTYSTTKDIELHNKFVKFGSEADKRAFPDWDIENIREDYISMSNKRYAEGGTYTAALELTCILFMPEIKNLISEQLEKEKEDAKDPSLSYFSDLLDPYREPFPNCAKDFGLWFDNTLWNEFLDPYLFTGISRKQNQNGTFTSLKASAEDCLAKLDELFYGLNNFTDEEKNDYRKKCKEFNAKQKHPNSPIGKSRLIEYKTFLLNYMLTQQYFENSFEYFREKKELGIKPNLYKRIEEELTPKPY